MKKMYIQKWFYKTVDHVLPEHTPNIPKVVVEKCTKIFNQANA